LHVKDPRAYECIIAIEPLTVPAQHEAVAEVDVTRHLEHFALDGKPVDRSRSGRLGALDPVDVDGAEIDAAGAIRHHLVNAVDDLALDFVQQPPGPSSLRMIPPDAPGTGGQNRSIRVHQ
jgi:hypothetical protein